MGEAFWGDCGPRSGARTLVQLGDIREEERGIFFFREGRVMYLCGRADVAGLVGVWLWLMLLFGVW